MLCGCSSVIGRPARTDRPTASAPSGSTPTTRTRAAPSSDAILFRAPRTLNVRVGLNVSILRWMSASKSLDSNGDRSSGARGRCRSTTRRAATTSATVGSRCTARRYFGNERGSRAGVLQWGAYGSSPNARSRSAAARREERPRDEAIFLVTDIHHRRIAGERGETRANWNDQEARQRPRFWIHSAERWNGPLLPSVLGDRCELRRPRRGPDRDLREDDGPAA